MPPSEASPPGEDEPQPDEKHTTHRGPKRGSVRRNRARLALAGALVLVVVAVIVVVIAIRSQQSAPQPAAAPTTAAPPSSAAPSGPSASASASPAPKRRAKPLTTSSPPVKLKIPSIGVDSSVKQLGLKPDHTLQVPPLGPEKVAGWYKQSPSPGELGPSIILGHVDSAKYGPGEFFRLGAMKQGSTFSMKRADGRTVTFRVDRVRSTKKSAFPASEVYGDLNYAGVRLITCGGTFDPAAHSYESNIIVFGSLISTSR